MVSRAARVPSSLTVSTTSYDVMCSSPVPTSAAAGAAATRPVKATTASIASPRRSIESAILAAVSACEGPLHLPLGLLLGQRLPLVVGLLAAAERDLDLCLAVLEVERDRDESDPALLGLADQPDDLGAVQQQLAFPPRLVVGPGALGVLRDVHAGQPRLAVPDVGVAVDQVGVPGAQGLDLGAGQHQPRLEDVVDVVVVPGLAVLGHQLAALLLGH